MRILIINQPYWPDVVATAQHMADWAAHLAARGHTVTVIASRSVYGQQGGALPRQQAHEGVTIYRVGSNLFRKGRIVTRLIDFGLFHVRALIKAMRLPRQDVVVCLTTPPFIGVVGMLLKSLRGSRYVQYEMDVYPDIAVALGTLSRGGLLAGVFERLHRRLLRAADRVVVLGRCMKQVIVSKPIAGIEHKTVLVTPWAASGEIPAEVPAEDFLRKHGLENACVVMYAGNLGLGHDTRTLLAMIERLRDDAGVRFVFVGGGRRMKDITRAVEEKGYSNVLVLDYAPRAELEAMLSAATIHLISQATGTTGLIVPSKLYGILASGRPSIYIGPPDTEIALTLAEHRAGAVIAPGNVDALLAAIRAYRQASRDAREEMERCTRAALAGHTRQHCVATLTDMVESLITR